MCVALGLAVQKPRLSALKHIPGFEKKIAWDMLQFGGVLGER
jgi:hypothetical protein